VRLKDILKDTGDLISVNPQKEGEVYTENSTFKYVNRTSVMPTPSNADPCQT